MTDSLVEQVDTTLKISEDGEDVVERVNRSEDGSDHEEKGRVDDEEADEPAESEQVRENRRLLEEAQSELAELPETHEDRPRKMLRVASAMDTLYCSKGYEAEEPFLEALKLCNEVRESVGPDEWDQTAAMYFQCDISFSLYFVDKDVSYLHMAVAFGRESITWMIDRNYRETGSAYSGRCELLARVLKKLFDVENLTEHINNAVVFQGKCVDGTGREEDNDEGSTVLYSRYKVWAALWVRLMDRRPELKIDDLIEQIEEKFPCGLDDEGRVDHNYWQIRFGMQCRRWARTKDDDHFVVILQSGGELLKWEANDPACSCHGNEDDQKFCSDPDDANHVIRRAAGFFDEWFRMDDSDSEWYNHLASINTSLALWEAAYDNVSRETFADVQKDLLPLQRMQGRLQTKYEITKNPDDGWQYDNKAWESSQLSILSDHLARGVAQPDHFLSDYFDDGKFTAYGTSIVAQQEYSVWGAGGVKKPWNLDDMRFKFLNGEWTEENWIRERSADGKFILGGAESPRDLDIFKFLAGNSVTTGNESLPTDSIHSAKEAIEND